MRVVNIRGKKDIELWSWKEKILNISKGAFQPHSLLLPRIHSVIKMHQLYVLLHN